MSDNVWFATAQSDVSKTASGFTGIVRPLTFQQQSGYEISVWDGSTLYSSIPSGSSGSAQIVVGPGTLYPVAMSLEDMATLFWRPRSFNLTSPGSISATATCIASGVSPSGSSSISISDSSLSGVRNYVLNAAPYGNEELELITRNLASYYSASGGDSDTDDEAATSIFFFISLRMTGEVIILNGQYWPKIQITISVSADGTPLNGWRASHASSYRGWSYYGAQDTSPSDSPPDVVNTPETYTATILVGALSVSIPMRGVHTIVQDSAPGTPFVSTSLVPTSFSSLTYTADEYWPYAAPDKVLFPRVGYTVGEDHPNAGLPIYNTTTGAQLLDPVTGF